MKAILWVPKILIIISLIGVALVARQCICRGDHGLSGDSGIT